MCPNSENGQHNYHMFSVVTDNGTIVVKVCTLCQAEG